MQLEVKGLRELEERLALLGPVAGAKVMRQAMFAASKPILDQAKRNLAAFPGGSGALHLAMGRTFRVGGRGGLSAVLAGGAQGSTFTVMIGPRVGARSAIALHNLAYHRHIRGIFYGHLVEFGHRIGNGRTGYLRKLNRPNSTRHEGLGTVPARRFLRPALDTGGLRAIFLLRNELGRRIDRALKKQNPAAEKV